MLDDLNYMHKDGFQLTSLDIIIISEKLYRERCISFMCSIAGINCTVTNTLL